MWVPQVGSCARMAQVWRGGKGPESPGLLPALSGHGERIARTTPPPGGHSGPASTSDAPGGDLNPAAIRLFTGVGARGWVGGGARALEALLVRAAGGPFRTLSTKKGRSPKPAAPATPPRGEWGVLIFGGGVWSSVLCPRASGLVHVLCVALRCLGGLCGFCGLGMVFFVLRSLS